MKKNGQLNQENKPVEKDQKRGKKSKRGGFQNKIIKFRP
jgi:hypothetical protein